jgi:hypothetical protein
MDARRSAVVLVVALLTSTCVLRPIDVPRLPTTDGGLQLDGVMSIAPNTPFAALKGVVFGGVSGLVYDAARGELLGICDDHNDARVFRMRLRDEPLEVEPIGAITLQMATGGPSGLDAEGIAILPDGHLLIASEGSGSRDPRSPPAIVEYLRDGRFVRQWPVPDAFIPTPHGQQTSGIRANEAFESLTVTPDGRHVFTGTESALVQDDEAASFERGARSRLLEYERRGHRYVPAHEYAYDVEAIPSAPFAPGSAINGLVELLALEGRDLLALERSYVDDPSRRGRGVNHIRLYRVSLANATDVMSRPSLRNRAITPVSKTLLVDLGALPDIPDDLRELDNFEGLALLPPRHGRTSLLMVSDDNFSPTERTWFVRLTPK